MPTDRLQLLFVLYEDGSTEYAIHPLSDLFEYGEPIKPHLTRFRAFTPMIEREAMHAREQNREPRKVASVYDTCIEDRELGRLPWEYERDLGEGRVPAPPIAPDTST